jgi:AcrR family transcriptional regulator
MTVPAPPWQRAPRSRPAKPPLTREAIVDAAMRVLDAEGVAGLSMRRVAQELNTGAASLYAHVSNRYELEDLVFDRIAGEVPLPGEPDPQRWQEQVKQLMRDSRAALNRHPGSARLVLARVPFTPNALVQLEALLALLRCGGVSDRTASFAVDLLFLYTTATAFEETVYLQQGLTPEAVQERFTQMGGYLRSLPADRFPHLVSMVDVLLSGGGEERFEFGLDILVSGLAATVR